MLRTGDPQMGLQEVVKGNQEPEVTTKKIEKVARISGVKPKNIKGLYDVNRKMFGQMPGSYSYYRVYLPVLRQLMV